MLLRLFKSHPRLWLPVGAIVLAVGAVFVTFLLLTPRADITLQTLQGMVEINMIDDFDHNKSEEKYYLKTRGGAFQLRNPNPTARQRLLQAANTIVTVQGQVLGKNLVLAGNGSTGGVYGSPQTALPAPTSTTLNMAVIVLQYPEMPYTDVNKWRGQIFSDKDSTKNLIAEISSQKMQLTGEVFGPFTVPAPSADCRENQTRGFTAALAANVPLKQFQYVQFVVPKYPPKVCYYSGIARLNGAVSMVMNNTPWMISALELGHNLGFDQAGAYNNPVDIPGGGVNPSPPGPLINFRPSPQPTTSCLWLWLENQGLRNSCTDSSPVPTPMPPLFPIPSSSPFPSPSDFPVPTPSVSKCTNSVDCYEPHLTLLQPTSDVTVTNDNPAVTLSYTVSLGKPLENQPVVYFFAQNMVTSEITPIPGCVSLVNQNSCTWYLSSYSAGTYGLLGVVGVDGKTPSTPVPYIKVTYQKSGGGPDTCTTVDCYGPKVTITQPAGDFSVSRSPATFSYTLSFGNPKPATSGAKVYFFAHNITTNQITTILSCANLTAPGTCNWDLSTYSPAYYQIYVIVAIPDKTNSTTQALNHMTYQP